MVSNSVMAGQHLVSQTFTFEFRDFSVAYRNPEHDQNMCSSCWFGFNLICFCFSNRNELFNGLSRWNGGPHSPLHRL